ncbi:MAG: RraA family protein [Betaproteobacteria bacterium]|jgi:regulator of RNase E activity RraA
MTFNGYAISPRVEPLSKEISELTGLPTSMVSDSLGRNLVAKQILPINKAPISVCANAFTVEVRSGDNLMIHKALQMIQPGDALIIAGDGDIDRALFGEILMTIAKKRGVVACVVDGAVRDIDAFDRESFPCWARGISLRGPFKDGPGTINQPITIGGMEVHPGDIILGDLDGVIAIPRHIAKDAVRLGKEKQLSEEKTITAILNGSYDDSWVDKTLRAKGAL